MTMPKMVVFSVTVSPPETVWRQRTEGLILIRLLESTVNNKMRRAADKCSDYRLHFLGVLVKKSTGNIHRITNLNMQVTRASRNERLGCFSALIWPWPSDGAKHSKTHLYNIGSYKGLRTQLLLLNNNSIVVVIKNARQHSQSGADIQLKAQQETKLGHDYC